jgi:hypothetical protein
MFGFIKKLFGSADVNKDGKVDATDAKIVVETVKAEVKEAAVEVKAEVKKVAAKTTQTVKQAVNKAKPRTGNRKPKPKSKA